MPGKEGLGPGGVPYLKEELCALFHDLLDLEEARRVHEQELVAHGHAEAARVAEGQDLLEALGLHCRGQLHHRALAPSIEQVPEVGATGGQHRAVGLGEGSRSRNGVKGEEVGWRGGWLVKEMDESSQCLATRPL